jgi:hypothetical protein
MCPGNELVTLDARRAVAADASVEIVSAADAQVTTHAALVIRNRTPGAERHRRPWDLTCLERADIILPPLRDDQADLEGSMQSPAGQRHFATPLRD